MQRVMLYEHERRSAGEWLKKLGAAIDLTERQYQDAVNYYQEVGQFLSDAGGSLGIYKPALVPQGSFRIGTVIRPERNGGEFDVDATCRLQIALPERQSFIKQLVENRLLDSSKYRNLLKEKHRCWRLPSYDNSRFHLDIVPGIPDDIEWLIKAGVPYHLARHAVRITDNRHPEYNLISYDWLGSNPEGYALWFLEVMRLQADQIRMKLAAELRLSVEQVPEYKIRTPLQRAVQFMKRHRDELYGDDELKPISVIITTLAARAYTDVMRRNPGGLFYDIIVEIAERMTDYIVDIQGISWVYNPVNPFENFADKWQLEPALRDTFYSWHSQFVGTLKGEQLFKQESTAGAYLKLSFGENTVERMFENSAGSADQQRIDGLRRTAALIAGGGAYTDQYGNINERTGVKNEPHRFHYGKV